MPTPRKESLWDTLQSEENPHQSRLDGRWGELLEPEEGYELALEAPEQAVHRALDFRFSEPPEAVELRLADLEDGVVATWDFDLVPRVREIRIHYKVRGDDPLLGVAIPVGDAPPTAWPGVGLVVNLGDTVKLRVINDTPTERDFTIEGLGIQSPPLTPFVKWEKAWQYEFTADIPGRFGFYDSRDPYRSINGTFTIVSPSDQANEC